MEPAGVLGPVMGRIPRNLHSTSMEHLTLHGEIRELDRIKVDVRPCAIGAKGEVVLSLDVDGSAVSSAAS